MNKPELSWFPEWFDDKSQVILALFVIAVLCILEPPDESVVNIVNNIISGMLGLALGRATKTS